MGEIVKFDTTTLTEVGTFQGVHSAAVMYTIVTGDDKQLLTFSGDGQCAIWKIDTPESTGEILMETDNQDSFHVPFLSSNNQYLFASDYAWNVHCFDLKSRTKRETLRPFENITYDIAVTPDNNYVIFSSDNKELLVYNAKTLEFHKKLLGHTTAPVIFASITSDGKYLLSCTTTEAIIWNAKTWENVVILEETFKPVNSKGRVLQGIIHDGCYKSWSNKLLASLSDDFVEGDEDDKKEINTAEGPEALSITGPLNLLFPMIL